jgi:hypothetical protein
MRHTQTTANDNHGPEVMTRANTITPLLATITLGLASLASMS